MNIPKKAWAAILLSVLTEILICAITIPLKDTALNEVYFFFHVMGPSQYWVTLLVAFVAYRSIQILSGAPTNRRTIPTLVALLILSVAMAIWNHVELKQIHREIAYPRIAQAAKNEHQAASARNYLAIQSHYPIILMLLLTAPTALLLWTASSRMKVTDEKLQQGG